MRRLRSSGLAAMLMAVALAQSSSTLLTPEIRRVGGRLACLCGTCNNTVGNCPMLECHYAKPAREKILAKQALGESDDQIVQAVVKETGLQALSAPPQEGFSLLAWVMPWIAIAIGLIGIWLFMRRFSARKHPALAPELDAEMLSRYRENIEKDMAKLD